MNKEEFNKLKERAHYNIDWLETSSDQNLEKIGNTFDQYIYQLEHTESDDYHTMDELYDHRTVLFAILCNTYKDICWKSKYHSDGTSEDGWFISGVDTPYGQVTYHQKMEFWNLFTCKELPKAPLYDGHTPEDALQRLKLFFFGKLLEDFKNE